MTLTVLPNAVLLNVSRQLIEDAEFDVTAMVMEDFQQAWNLRLDTAAFAGNGTADGNNGGFTGLFNAGIKAAAAQGNTSAGTLDFDDVTRCLTTVAPVVLKRQAALVDAPADAGEDDGDQGQQRAADFPGGAGGAELRGDRDDPGLPGGAGDGGAEHGRAGAVGRGLWGPQRAGGGGAGRLRV